MAEQNSQDNNDNNSDKMKILITGVHGLLMVQGSGLMVND